MHKEKDNFIPSVKTNENEWNLEKNNNSIEMH